ncbi:MAG: hypothetical protein ACRD6X_18245 [Pyrinomonadaceae bacterium]
MLKRVFLTAIVMIVINLVIAPVAFANDKREKELKFAENVKSEIIKLGTGTDAKVKVKLKNGTKFEGYVSAITDDSFTVVDKVTGDSTSIPYPSVKQIKGNNLSSGVIIAIGFAVFLIVLAILVSRSS